MLLCFMVWDSRWLGRTLLLDRFFLAIELLRSNHFLRSMPDLLSGKSILYFFCRLSVPERLPKWSVLFFACPAYFIEWTLLFLLLETFWSFLNPPMISLSLFRNMVGFLLYLFKSYPQYRHLDNPACGSLHRGHLIIFATIAFQHGIKNHPKMIETQTAFIQSRSLRQIIDSQGFIIWDSSL